MLIISYMLGFNTLFLDPGNFLYIRNGIIFLSRHASSEYLAFMLHNFDLPQSTKKPPAIKGCYNRTKSFLVREKSSRNIHFLCIHLSDPYIRAYIYLLRIGHSNPYRVKGIGHLLCFHRRNFPATRTTTRGS